MGLLDKKEHILNLILTQHGRKRLSEGNLNVSYYAFLDDEIDYEVSSGISTGSIFGVFDSIPWVWDLNGDLGVTLSGSDVVTWDDQSGLNNQAGQPTAANRPTYKSSNSGS